MTVKKVSIAIIIPSFNERKNLKKLLPIIFSLLPKAHIIVVDDNSPDGTKHTIKTMQKKYRSLHLVVRNSKKGRGSAVLEGFAYAKKHIHPTIYIEMDADLSHQPSELLSLISQSAPKTVVIASRYTPQSTILNVPLQRKLISRTANFLIHHTLRVPLTDHTNGFRAYQPDTVNVLLSHTFVSTGYIVLSESAYLLSLRGIVFKEIPSLFINRTMGKSNTNTAEFVSAMKDLFLIKKYVR